MNPGISDVNHAADDLDRERSTPVTRTRVVKGPLVNLQSQDLHSNPNAKIPTPPQPNILFKENPDLSAARDFKDSVTGSSKRGKKPSKGFKPTSEGFSKRVTKPTDEVMAESTKTPRPRYISYKRKFNSHF